MDCVPSNCEPEQTRPSLCCLCRVFCHSDGNLTSTNYVGEDEQEEKGISYMSGSGKLKLKKLQQVEE